MPEEQRNRIVIGNRFDGGVLRWVAMLYLFVALVGLCGLGVLSVGLYRHYALMLKPVPNLATYRSAAPGVSKIVAADGTILGEFAQEWREVIPFDRVPKRLIHAFLAAEDHRFFEHHGVELRSVFRALFANIGAGGITQGGSTITQQITKHFLDRTKTLGRKAKEAILARRIERKYSKKAILSLYLNHIFLGRFSGHDTHGISMTARRLFSKKVEELNLSEMATIAGLAKAPSLLSPFRYPDRARDRRNIVLDRMAKVGFITQPMADRWKTKPLVIAPPPEIFPTRSPYYTQYVHGMIKRRYPTQFEAKGRLRIETTLEPIVDTAADKNVDFGVRKQDKRQGWRGPVTNVSERAYSEFRKRSEHLYGDRDLIVGRRYLAVVESVTSSKAEVRVGRRIYTIHFSTTRWAAKWDERGVNNRTTTSLTRVFNVGDVVWVKRPNPKLDEYRDWVLFGQTPRWKPAKVSDKLEPDQVVLEQDPHPQGALFTADYRTGYVLASIGGVDFRRSQHDRVHRACRQPGSTYKPIYYARALDQGYHYHSRWNDVPKKEIDPITGIEWTPTNLGGTRTNEVTLEYALVFSKNVPSVAIFKALGAKDVEKWARKLGFTTPIVADKALALGASCTKLHELTRAFSIFARNGKWTDWTYVRRVYDGNGNIVEDNTVYYDPYLAPKDRLDRISARAWRPDIQQIPARTAVLITRLLRKVIKKGFASILRKTGIIAAGKTGTSSNTMDTLFVGFTSKWITTVWLGDELYIRPLGLKDAAYMTVVPMWARYMREVAKDHIEEIPWNPPPHLDPNDEGGSRGRIGEAMPLRWHKAAAPAE